MGTPEQALPHRLDNKLYRIQTPQSPIARTRIYKEYENDEYPAGTNAVPNPNPNPNPTAGTKAAPNANPNPTTGTKAAPNPNPTAATKAAPNPDPNPNLIPTLTLTPSLTQVVAVLAYTGFDMEDAMMINKSSMERGFGHASVYKVPLTPTPTPTLTLTP